MVNLKKLIKQHKKVFVLICGGSASGKNYYASQLDLPIVDVDEENKKLNNGKVDCRNTVSKAIQITKSKLEESFKKGESFVHVTTGSVLKFVENKLKMAKENGFFVIYIHVNTTLKQARLNNKERVKNGGHGSTIPDWKFRTTKIQSNYIFNLLKDGNLVDFYLQINGKRNYEHY
jgi:predicted kinase